MAHRLHGRRRRGLVGRPQRRGRPRDGGTPRRGFPPSSSAAASRPHRFEDARLAIWLRQIERRGTNIGALCTGSHVLARLGLLDGYRCTIHWENLPGFVEDFPDIDISEDIFVIDRNRYTCAGGMAASDMMLSFISRDHGYELAAAVSEGLVCERIRGEDDHQRMALRLRLAVSQPRLLSSINLMSEHIETPLSQAELAREVGLSTRQIERLFLKYLNCTPSRYYLDMRLNRARALLQQTCMSVTNVALATGFVSASHFSKVLSPALRTRAARDEAADQRVHALSLDRRRPAGAGASLVSCPKRSVGLTRCPLPRHGRACPTAVRFSFWRRGF